MIGQGLAVAAGICAALASIFAKLAVASNAVTDLCTKSLHSVLNWTTSPDDSDGPHENSSVMDLCSSATLIIRLLCFGLMFASNAVMWTLFVRSLQSTSSVIATITNTASNIFFTAVSGYVIFGEELPVTWWIGAALIVAGLVLMHVYVPSETAVQTSDDGSPVSARQGYIDKEKVS